MAYNEGNRYLYLQTPLGDSTLLLQSFTGAEGLSQLFDFQLELLAENATTINFDQLIGQRVSFGVVGTEAALIARDFNGIVVEFSQGPRDRVFTAYRMRVVPDIWKLTQKFQSRIFQHITVPDILKQVLTGFDVSYQIQGDFEQREYCTQYRETDFDFLSRLMEEEGIYYFFKFTPGAHQLVLANTPPSHPDIPGDSKVIYETTAGGYRDEERITVWQKEQLWGSGKYTTWDHHFQLPHKHLPAEATSAKSVQVGKVSHKLNLARNEDLEVYDYPAAYAQRFDGIDKSGGDQSADLQKIFPDAKRTDDIRIEQQETPMLRIQVISNCRQMTAGHKFTLQRHFNGDGKYVVLRVSHSAAEADFRSNRSEKGESHYTNQFTCLPYELPFRPPMVTEKPVIAGPQTAVVVGPAGEEIFTDKYGRVKVQFHWDRAGKYDGDSSCWLRVGTLWAGKQWGSVFIPRIGHEVIVGFIEGDADRPIVIGSVYNADTVTPYELPANKTRGGVKTDSSMGSGGFNEIRFEDKKGSEQIFIHGQKDSDTRIENDSREWIGEDRHLIVKRDKYEEVDRDIHIDIKRDHREKIEGDRNLTVLGKEAIQVSGTHSFQVTGDVAEQFGANHSEQTTQDYYLQANNVVLQDNASITLMVGSNFINISPLGIAIMGMPMVNINNGGAATPGTPGNPVSPVLPLAAIPADKANPGSEVVYSDDGDFPDYVPVARMVNPQGKGPSNQPQPGTPGTQPARKRTRPTHWIKISLIRIPDVKPPDWWIASKDGPYPGEPFRAQITDGRKTGALDGKGSVRYDGIPAGTCEIQFTQFYKLIDQLLGPPDSWPSATPGSLHGLATPGPKPASRLLKLDTVDPLFAPGVEQLDITYDIAHLQGEPVVLEIESAKTPGAPVYRKLLAGGEVADGNGKKLTWDGKSNIGAQSGKWIDPAHSPYAVVLKLDDGALQTQKPTKVEVDKIDITIDAPNDKIVMNDPAKKVLATSKVWIKKKAGGSTVTPIQIDVGYKFTADGGNTNAAQSYLVPGGSTLGKTGDPNALYWEAHTDSPSTSTDGYKTTCKAQTVTAAGANQGVAKVWFKPSAVGGNKYKVKAETFAADGATSLAAKETDQVTIWRKIVLTPYEMNGQTQVSTNGTTASMAAFYTADTFVEYELGTVHQIPAANSVTYIGLWDHATSAQLNWATHSAKIAAETPTAAETTAANGPAGPAQTAARAAIQAKANAWRDRIIAAYNAGLNNWATDAAVPVNAIVAIALEHPKYSAASPDSATTEWTVFPWLTITVEGKVIQPDQRWINGQGVSYGNRAYITAGMSVARTKVAIAHEAGHETKNQFKRDLFGRATSPRRPFRVGRADGSGGFAQCLHRTGKAIPEGN